MHTDPRTMAKLVECVPNFSEGNNKEVRDCVEGWVMPGCRWLDCPSEAAVQAAPAARFCLASFKALCTFTCLANAENAVGQSLLPSGSLVRSGGSAFPPPPLPAGCCSTRVRLGVVWHTPLEKYHLQWLCQNMPARLMESVLGISPRLNFGPAGAREVQQT